MKPGIMAMWERTPPALKDELGQKSLDAGMNYA